MSQFLVGSERTPQVFFLPSEGQKVGGALKKLDYVAGQFTALRHLLRS